MRQAIKLTARDVPPMLRSAFPDYRGRKWRAVITDRVYTSDTHWGGGTRNEYREVDLRTGRVFEPRAGAFGSGFEPREPVIGLEPGRVVVEHSIFMGKDTGITIYVHPQDVVPLRLPSSTGGKRRSAFAKLTRKLAARGATSPKALAAWIGRKQIGQAEMTRRAVKGRKRGGKRRGTAGLIAAVKALREAMKG